MKAYVLHGIDDLRYEEVNKPVTTSNSVLVKVEAVGICGSDIPRIFRTGAHRHPLIPGHEFAGTVVECGSDVNSRWLQKRVGIFPLIPCMECAQCVRQRYEMCKNYSYLGSRTDGGFAEYVLVPEWNLIELPGKVSFEQAAMLEPASVARHAVKGIGVNPGDRITICGLGTIGLLIAMILRGYGCKEVLLLGNKDTQRKLITDIGYEERLFCNTKETSPTEWIRNMTAGEGVNVFFECVGKNDIVNLALDATTPGGKIMLVGNPASDMQFDKNQYWNILRKQLTLRGTWNSSFTKDEGDDWHDVLGLIEAGDINPELLITHRYPLERLREGMEIMRDKSEDYVKIMAVL